MKIEMFNPPYQSRFGVILEAYLQGCGEAMLQCFEEQVSMQQKLEEIGRKVGEHTNGFTLLRESLAQFC